MTYNMQNGILNWGKLEMEMECDAMISHGKKCLLNIQIDYCLLY